MGMKRSPAAKRAWNILRIALLWARKGSVFRRRLIMDLNHVSKYLKTLKNGYGSRRSYIHYGERELSFDATPVIHVKMHRPASLRFMMPCIVKPEVDFDYDFETERGEEDNVSYDEDDNNNNNNNNNVEEERRSFLDQECEVCEEIIGQCDDDGVDERAEEFIAKFYEQMRLQRQISYFQYTETMISRGSD